MDLFLSLSQYKRCAASSISDTKVETFYVLSSEETVGPRFTVAHIVRLSVGACRKLYCVAMEDINPEASTRPSARSSHFTLSVSFLNITD